MQDANDWSSYKDESFFQNLIDAMEEYGYKLFSKVTISTDDAPYHVKFVSQARDTRMFFTGTKAVLCMIGYHEKTYDDGSGSHKYWHLDIDANINPNRVVNTITWDERNDEGDYSHSAPAIEGFRSGYSSIGENRSERSWTMENSIETLTPGEVAAHVASGLDELSLYANELPFKSLQVTSWVPSYCFKDCHNTFWERFDRKALRSIVKDPWGGTN